MCVCSQPSRLVMSMILVYGDDSADEQRQRVSALAIAVGKKDAWDEFEPRWKARNDGIPFHAKDCETDNGDYARFPHEHNKALYKDLTVMIAESDLIGRAIAIDLKAQREAFPDGPDVAYFKAFAELLEAVKDVCAHFQLPAKFAFDIGPENEYNAGLLYQGTRECSPKMLEWFDPEISFLSAKNSAKLQVADLLAYEAMKNVDNELSATGHKRRSWQALARTNRFSVIAYSIEWFEDVKRNMPRLEELSGFNRSDYIQWLKDRNRQHSISNLIHFTNWIAIRDQKQGN